MIMNMNMNMNMNMDMNAHVTTYGHWSIMLVKRFGSSSNLMSSSGGIAALLCLHNQR